MKEIKLSLISLGCEKNLVDSEMILGSFDKMNVKIVKELNDANIIIVNTCGFIESAKQEAIDTIFSVIDYKKNGAKIIATGCLVQRYMEELKKAIPEVDLWIPLKDYYRIGEIISAFLNDNIYKSMCLSMNERLLSTPSHLAYLRISDGCDNRCTYCAIPIIRGSFKSREVEEIVEEFKWLVKTNHKEICLISQDLTKYGIDLKNTTLNSLLLKLLEVEGDYKIRMLYLYPDEITDELINTVKNNSKVMPYFDIPIQHASNKILRWMNRRGTKEFISELIYKIRKEIPDCVIRTTLIVGFPHETEKDFEELKEFITVNKFDHLGVFMYSKEEDTKSYFMTHQVPKKQKEKRYNEIMEIQKWISLKQNQKYLSNIYECIVESFDEEENIYYARGYMFAPDDIDGEVIIKSNLKLDISKIYKCKITSVDFYDIYAEVIN